MTKNKHAHIRDIENLSFDQMHTHMILTAYDVNADAVNHITQSSNCQRDHSVLH